MSKTPDYTKRAIASYQSKKDRVNLLLAPGTKDKIKQKYGTDANITAYIKALIDNDLKSNTSSAVPEFMRD